MQASFPPSFQLSQVAMLAVGWDKYSETPAIKRLRYNAPRLMTDLLSLIPRPRPAFFCFSFMRGESLGTRLRLASVVTSLEGKTGR